MNGSKIESYVWGPIFVIGGILALVNGIVGPGLLVLVLGIAVISITFLFG